MAMSQFTESARAAALGLGLPLEHVGPLDAGCSGPEWTRREAAGVSLALRLAGEAGTVAAIRCQAASAAAGDQALLEQFCRACLGLSLEEAAAYAGDYALHRLGAALPAMGVRPPTRAIPILATVQDILRGLRRERRGGAEVPQLEDAHLLALPAAWTEVGDAERLQRTRAGLAAALVALGESAELLALTTIDRDIRGRPVRCVLDVLGAIEPARLPALLRQVEQHLRRQVAPWLELYVEERDDRNQLRKGIVDKDERKIWVMNTQAVAAGGTGD